MSATETERDEMGVLPHNLWPRRLFAPRRVFMTVVDVDAKSNAVKLRCPEPECRHDGGWMVGLTATERGRQPCPRCNAPQANPTKKAT